MLGQRLFSRYVDNKNLVSKFRRTFNRTLNFQIDFSNQIKTGSLQVYPNSTNEKAGRRADTAEPRLLTMKRIGSLRAANNITRPAFDRS
jgi:hypothetical protein